MVDLYKQGYAGEIVIARNTVRGHDLVVNQGMEIPHDSEYCGSTVGSTGRKGNYPAPLSMAILMLCFSGRVGDLKRGVQGYLDYKIDAIRKGQTRLIHGYGGKLILASAWRRQ